LRPFSAHLVTKQQPFQHCLEEMSNSSHFGTPQQNVVSPFTADVKVELKEVVELDVASVDNLQEESQVPDSSVLGMQESQDSMVNVVTVVDKEPCVYCGQNPCDWVMFEEDILEECEVLEEEKRSNKEIRHHAYRLYTRLKHGVLRKYDRRPLPICVRGEIMDNWPDPNRTYVGFQAALRDVSDMG
jgi:hypothetical protein